MSKGRWSKLLWIAALVPLLGASVLPTQMLALVCRFTGALMDEEACCPLGNQEQAAPVSRLLDQGCCVVRTVDLPKLLSDRQVNGPGRYDAQTLLSKLSSDLPPPDAVGLPLHRVRPPPLDRPLRLLKRSFLI
jgi:hypothetical protein